MATAIERFSSLGESATSAHGSRHSDPIEIIDVDLLDDDDDDDGVQVIRSRPSSRPVAGPSRLPEPSRRVSETILFVDDSDDETPPTISTHRVERRRLFSPPPPRHNLPLATIPPVPRVPSQYSGHTSMVIRQGPRGGPPPPVQPLNRTFSFNFGRVSSPAAGPAQEQPEATTSRSHEPGPPGHSASRSQQVPNLGLGGALLANNRARVAHERGFARELPRAGFWGIPQAFQRIYPGLISPYAHLLGTDDASLFDDEEELAFADIMRRRDRFRQPLTEKDHYKPAYTHPVPAEPGFTHDFSSEPVSDDAPAFPLSSKSDPIIIVDEHDQKSPKDEKLNCLLVCARCQEPLILNSGLTGSDSTQHKIWALRCGHLIDGKCLGEIGQPRQVVDRKGKGKAKEEIPYGEITDHHDSADLATIPETSIRSRLRSRARASASNGTSSSSIPAASPDSRKRKAGKTAVKGSPNKKRKIEEEYEWLCPVSGCGKTHASVKIGGVWGPEKERQFKGKKDAAKFSISSEGAARGVIAVFA